MMYIRGGERFHQKPEEGRRLSPPTSSLLMEGASLVATTMEGTEHVIDISHMEKEGTIQDSGQERDNASPI